MIHQLPLIKEMGEDSFMWMHLVDGEYTVKSSYKAIRLWHNQSLEGPSHQEEDQNLWKKVWNLKTIPRHKEFIWRLLNIALPTRMEFHKRGVTNNFMCPRCGIKMETINHVFMECPFSIQIWFGHHLSIRFSDDRDYEFFDWLRNFFINSDEDSTRDVVSIAYSIWYARNKKVFEDLNITPETLLSMR